MAYGIGAISSFHFSQYEVSKGWFSYPQVTLAAYPYRSGDLKYLDMIPLTRNVINTTPITIKGKQHWHNILSLQT